MRNLLRSLMYELGTGRALDNACRERDEVARTVALVDALAGRLGPGAPVVEHVADRFAA